MRSCHRVYAFAAKSNERHQPYFVTYSVIRWASPDGSPSRTEIQIWKTSRFALRSFTLSYLFGVPTQYGCLLSWDASFTISKQSTEKYGWFIKSTSQLISFNSIIFRRLSPIDSKIDRGSSLTSSFRKDSPSLFRSRSVLTDYTWAGFALPTTSIIFCSSFVTLTGIRTNDMLGTRLR